MIDQQPHQLGDRHRRMRVVELDRGLVGQRTDVAEILDVPPHDVLDGGGGEEILLPEPQFLPRRRGVVGVEYAHQRFRAQLTSERAREIAFVEPVESDRVKRLGGPQPERVDPLAAPADDRRVDRYRLDRLGWPPMHRAAWRLGHLAAEAHEIRALAPFELPRIAVRQPVLGQLDLPAVVDPLAEHAVHVTDAVAVGGQVHAREAVHEARGQPPEPAVAERGVGLDLFQRGEIHAQRRKRLADGVGERQIVERVAQQAADQELEAEIIDPFRPRRVRRLGRGHPAVDDVVTHGQDRRGEPVVRPRRSRVLADAVDQRVEDGVGERRGGCLGAKGKVHYAYSCEQAQANP